jgi:hypothetical protein
MKHFHQEEEMKNQSKAFSAKCSPKYGHGLVAAPEIWRRIAINREPSRKVARSLGMEVTTLDGVMRILKERRGVPSPERLALVAMRVPDVTDEDIAGWWGKSVAWAAAVRRHADFWRECDPIREELEYIDDGYQPGDPSPEEIYAMAARIRTVAGRRLPTGKDSVFGGARCAIRSYGWNRKHASFIPNCPD